DSSDGLIENVRSDDLHAVERNRRAADPGRSVGAPIDDHELACLSPAMLEVLAERLRRTGSSGVLLRSEDRCRLRVGVRLSHSCEQREHCDQNDASAHGYLLWLCLRRLALPKSGTFELSPANQRDIPRSAQPRNSKATSVPPSSWCSPCQRRRPINISRH